MLSNICQLTFYKWMLTRLIVEAIKSSETTAVN